MPKYSVLVKTVVNVRIDNIKAISQTDAIAVATGMGYGNRFDSGEINKPFRSPVYADGTTPSLRYTEWAEEDAYFLVDEEGDEEYERSVWYAKDGVTALSNPGEGGITEICSECNQAIPRQPVTWQK